MSHNNIMGANLTIGRWSGRKFDRKVSDRTIADYGAAEGSIRGNKLLLPKHVFKPINVAYNNLYKTHKENTLPWGDDDTRVLKPAEYFNYMEKIRGKKEEYEIAADNFAQRYPELVRQAPSWLQGAFDERDYPPAEEIRGKYYVDLYIHGIAEASDFRIDLGDDEVRRIREQIEERDKVSLALATQEVWDRVHSTLSKLVESLSRVDGSFHRSLYENAIGLTQLLPTLNLADDPKLEKARKEIEQTLLKIDPDSVGKDKAYKADCADKTNELLDKMKKYGAL